MVDPLRLRIEKKIVEVLNTIRKKDDYFNDMNTSLDYIRSEDVPDDQFPISMPRVGNSLYTPLTNQEYTSGASRNDPDGWVVGIISYYKMKSDESFHEVIEKLHHDVMKAMLSNLTLDGLVITVYLHTITEPSLHTAHNHNVATTMVVFKIKYDFDRTDI